MNSKVHLYPFDTMPDLKFPSVEPVSCIDARDLSQEELVLLQSAYVWLQTHNPAITMAPPLQGSFSELYYILYGFELTQNIVRTFPSWWTCYVDAHKERYKQASRLYEFASFNEVLQYDFAVLKAVICNCAGFHFDLQRMQAMQASFLEHAISE